VKASIVQTEFCLLGPITVRHGGIAVPVAHGKQRSVLVASLLLSAGHMVSLSEIAEHCKVRGRRHPPALIEREPVHGTRWPALRRWSVQLALGRRIVCCAF
jgi:hypothetical protein